MGRMYLGSHGDVRDSVQPTHNCTAHITMPHNKGLKTVHLDAGCASKRNSIYSTWLCLPIYNVSFIREHSENMHKKTERSKTKMYTIQNRIYSHQRRRHLNGGGHVKTAETQGAQWCPPSDECDTLGLHGPLRSPQLQVHTA